MGRGRDRFGAPGDHASVPSASSHRDRREERRAAREARRGRAPLSPEERAYEQARRAAARKMGFFAHLVPYLSVCVFLLFVAGFRPAFVVALSWGIGLACHYFFSFVAPGLRERLVRDEVERQVERGVTRERRQLADEHAQRLESLSASIAHEIRNPITAAKSLVQQMGEDPRSGENVEYAKVALEELDRVERSISHLLRFAREEEMRLAPVNLADVVRSALDTLAERTARLRVQVVASVDGAGSLVADGEQLRRVLLNLLGNALDAFEEAGTRAPRLELQGGHNLAGTEVWLRVRDNGPGMDERRLGKIFDPFYTSKAEGTGLGLAISKKLVGAHGGRIEAHSQPGAGTEFVLTLPREHAEVATRR
ncbi:MAG TPA: ATP-binding protein [Myxococcota bacterium]|nr:ATP-binding protein [Myxococcota bacterium]